MIGGFLTKAAFKSVGGWILSNAKVIIFGLLAIAVLWLGFKVWGVYEERNNLLQEREQTVARLLQDLTLAEISAQGAEEAIARLEDHMVHLEQLQAETLAAQADIRADVRDQKAVLEDQQRLARLTRAKPGLIENLANKATRERFDELDATFND